MNTKMRQNKDGDVQRKVVVVQRHFGGVNGKHWSRNSKSNGEIDRIGNCHKGEVKTSGYGEVWSVVNKCMWCTVAILYITRKNVSEYSSTSTAVMRRESEIEKKRREWVSLVNNSIDRSYICVFVGKCVVCLFHRVCWRLPNLSLSVGTVVPLIRSGT